MWTMLEGFQHLSGEEIDTLVKAPVWITVLVGAADGELDREERMWTERLMRARTYSRPQLINEYYRIVSDDFLKKVDETLAGLPEEVEARNETLATQLGAVNPILEKLDEKLAATLYKSWIVLAQEAAKASGGFLRIGSVSAVEHLWVKLPMITPIIATGDPDSDFDEKEQED